METAHTVSTLTHHSENDLSAVTQQSMMPFPHVAPFHSLVFKEQRFSAQWGGEKEESRGNVKWDKDGLGIACGSTGYNARQDKIKK